MILKQINEACISHLELYFCRMLSSVLTSSSEFSLLAAQRMHLLIEVCDLHPGLREVTQLLGQMGQEILQVGSGAPRCVAAHGDHLLQFVVQGRIDGPDGILAAEK